jgi:hypothetical protein
VWRKIRHTAQAISSVQLIGACMPDIKTVLLLFGFVFMLMAVVRIVLQKQRPQPTRTKTPGRPATPGPKPRMTLEQFEKSWKSLSYLMLLAAAGNLFMLYNSVRGALQTQSYILWIDSFANLVAAVLAIIIWRKHSKKFVVAYMVITVIPIMFFMSTNHAADGLIRLFPLVLVYFVVQPVWEYLDAPGIEPV